MKSAIILGAGQMGQALYPLINHSTYLVEAFGDNNSELLNTKLYDIPVLSVKQALNRKPDTVFIGVAGEKRGQELEEQVCELGFTGNIIRLDQQKTQWDIRGAAAQKMAQKLEQMGVQGAVAELGVYQGEFAKILNQVFPKRKLYLFDTFEGFDKRDIQIEQTGNFSQGKTGDFSDTNVQLVIGKLKYPENAAVLKGYFPQTAEGIEEKFAFVSLDADLYEPTAAGLAWFLPRLAKGGVILLHDYDSKRFEGVKKAVSDYRQKTGQKLMVIPLGDVHGSVWVIPC